MIVFKFITTRMYVGRTLEDNDPMVTLTSYPKDFDLSNSNDKYNDNNVDNNNNNNNNKDDDAKCAMILEEAPIRECPMCMYIFPSNFDLNQKNIHVNKCLSESMDDF